MQQGTLAVAELVGVIDGAGTAFGWTRSYRNVVGTAIGAAYRAAGLDEDTDRIAVDPGSAESIAVRIVETAEVDGLSPRTATTYASTWKRLAGLALAPQRRRRHASTQGLGGFSDFEQFCHTEP